MNFHGNATLPIEISKVADFINVAAFCISTVHTVLLALWPWDFVDAPTHGTLMADCCRFNFFNFGCIAVCLGPTYAVTISRVLLQTT